MALKYDFAIIGAGVLGCAIAYQLAAAGRTVVVVDKEGIAGGASGGNLGQISLVDRTEPWHMELALESLREYKTLEEKYKFGFRQTGGCVLLSNDAQVSRAESVKSILGEYGVSSELLRKKKAQAMEPMLDVKRVKGLYYCAEEGMLEPLQVTFLFQEMASRYGVQFRSGEALLGFDMTGGVIEKARTTAGTLAADCFINCAGGWAGDVANLAGEAIPVCHHRGTAMVSQAVPRLLRTTLVGGGFLMGNAAGPRPSLHIGTALCQQENGTILMAQATEESPADSRAVSVAGITGIGANLLAYFPGFKQLDVLRVWAVSTAFSADGNPVFGKHQGLDNLFTFAGFKGAFTTAPAVARKAATLLLYGNNNLPDLAPGPERKINHVD